MPTSLKNTYQENPKTAFTARIADMRSAHLGFGYKNRLGITFQGTIVSASIICADIMIAAKTNEPVACLNYHRPQSALFLAANGSVLINP